MKKELAKACGLGVLKMLVLYALGMLFIISLRGVQLLHDNKADYALESWIDFIYIAFSVIATLILGLGLLEVIKTLKLRTK